MKTCKIGIVKAINATFIEIKDEKHCSKLQQANPN
jgi:hypothetical protein